MREITYSLGVIYDMVKCKYLKLVDRFYIYFKLSRARLPVCLEYRKLIFMTHFLRMTGIQFTNCELSGFVNDFDGDMPYVVPEGKAMTGVVSSHDNSKE